MEDRQGSVHCIATVKIQLEDVEGAAARSDVREAASADCYRDGGPRSAEGGPRSKFTGLALWTLATCALGRMTPRGLHL